MPVNIQQINEERGEVRVPLGDDEVVVGYRASAIAEDFGKRYRGKNTDAVLAEVLTDWDLVQSSGNDEKPFPLTLEGLKSIKNYPFKNRILEAVLADAFPNLTKLAGLSLDT